MFCDELLYKHISKETYAIMLRAYLKAREDKLREFPILMCEWCSWHITQTEINDCEQCAVYYLKQHLIETEEQ